MDWCLPGGVLGQQGVDGVVVEPVQQRGGEVVLGSRLPQRVEQACMAVYGIGPIRSAIGSARVRSGWAALAPSEAAPAWTPRMATISWPCTASGRNGTGAATRMLASVVSSSGMDAVRSHQPRSTWTAADPA
jgi:hypothetical protein